MRATGDTPSCALHLEGGTDVVVLEGSSRAGTPAWHWYEFPAEVTRFHFAAG